MRVKNMLLRFFASFALSTMLAVGNMFCLVTAFNIPANGLTFVAIAAFMASVFSLLFADEKTNPIAAALVGAGVLVYLYANRMGIYHGFQTVLNVMLSKYSAAYNWVFDIDQTYIQNGEATIFIAVVGMVVCFVSAWTISRQAQLGPLGLVSGGLLYPCLMIIDSPPSAGPFLMLAAVYVLLVLTQSRRRAGETGNHAIVWGMLLPSILVVALVYSFVMRHPVAGTDWVEKLRQDFHEQAEKHALFRQDGETGEIRFVNPTGGDTLGSFVWNEQLDEVDLSTISGQRSNRQRIMQVYSDREERLYLRGNSFASYENNTWSEIRENFYSLTTVPEEVWQGSAVYYDGMNYDPENPVINSDILYGGSAANLNIGIRYSRQSSIFYLPFVPGGLPEGAEAYYDAYVLNPEGVTDYYAPYAWYARSTGTSSSYEQFVYNIYRQIPDDTRRALEEIIGGEAWFGNFINPRDSVQSSITEYLAYSVAQFVTNSARYDLATPAVPEGEDFVSWFLNESETGYCVHFATAATMMLRALNIPARYVNGYVVDTKAGEWVDVTQNDAHAWVEFYSRANGWCLLEVTPASGIGSRGVEQQEEEEEDDIPPDDPETAPLPEQEEAPEEEPETEPETAAPGQERKGITVPVWVWYVIGFAAVCMGWNVLVRAVRKRRLGSGTRGGRTIKWYRFALFLAKLSGLTVSEEAEGIAMKARFSQHAVSQEELDAVVGQAEELRGKLLETRNVFKKMLYKFVFCL